MVNLELENSFNFQNGNIMSVIKFDDLLKTGAHFGHVTSKWNPHYEPYVLMVKNGVHIINLEETIKNLNNAIQFLQDTVRNKGEILFIGTKKQAKDIVQQEADKCRMYYVVERWLGGTLTNFSTIKKSIKRLQMLEKESSSIYENLTKKEIQMLNRERIKLSDQHRGIKDMRRLPDVLVVVDANHEATVIKEAKRLEIPIVAIVDSNTDPRPIDYPIPANDDSIRTIQLIISSIADGIITVRNEMKGGSDQEVAETVSDKNETPDAVTSLPGDGNSDTSSSENSGEELSLGKGDTEVESEEQDSTESDHSESNEETIDEGESDETSGDEPKEKDDPSKELKEEKK